MLGFHLVPLSNPNQNVLSVLARPSIQTKQELMQQGLRHKRGDWCPHDDLSAG